jgi:hypothetical protein
MAQFDLGSLLMMICSEWPNRIGKEYVDGVLHYSVKWCPTLEPVHSLEHAKERADEFEARLIALCMDKEWRKGPGVKRDGQSMMGADVSGGQQKKRPWGRPESKSEAGYQRLSL